MSFRTVEEVDDQIKSVHPFRCSSSARPSPPVRTELNARSPLSFFLLPRNLEKQVESGSLTIAAEKRSLNEITTLKRSRKNVEAFGDIQATIDADKARCDELSAQLDDPASKAVGDRFDAIKAELAELQKEGDILYEVSREYLGRSRACANGEADFVSFAIIVPSRGTSCLISDVRSWLPSTRSTAGVRRRRQSTRRPRTSTGARLPSQSAQLGRGLCTSRGADSCV